MGAIVRGRRFGGPYYVDPTDGTSGIVNVPPSASGISGAVFDLLSFLPSNADPGEANGTYPTQLGIQVRAINASGSDQTALVVRIKYSVDNIDWPDQYLGEIAGTFHAQGVGLDINWSNEAIVVPQGRYMVLEYENQNAVDPITVASRIYPKW